MPVIMFIASNSSEYLKTLVLALARMKSTNESSPSRKYLAVIKSQFVKFSSNVNGAIYLLQPLRLKGLRKVVSLFIKALLLKASLISPFK